RMAIGRPDREFPYVVNRRAVRPRLCRPRRIVERCLRAVKCGKQARPVLAAVATGVIVDLLLNQ
ncbi:MAG: hypothetical protein M3N82_12825, partial [Pseudomonadota bacterium]|nr:hypothetical protein [Pseudomonadota bacterium]